ncbi:MAG TPA: peptidyl-prolyl cis-trans isomerase [Polyangiaceae bacterium]
MRLGVLLVSALALSCSVESRSAVTRKSLPAGVAASVGGELVLVDTIVRIAVARGIDRAPARELAIRDALFAVAARAEPERADRVTVAERANLARRVLEGFEHEAENAGPPTDAELADVTAERWLDFDRPPSARTTHAVVLTKKPEDASVARALAERLAAALRGASTSAEFLERARAFPAAPLEVVAERLSPVTTDGRMWDPGARPGTKFPSLDSDYARAANAIERAGEHSPVVKSAFGYHVILLEERLPERRFTLDERRAALHDDIVARRAKKRLDETVTLLRRDTPVEIERTADSLTELVLGAP